MTGKSSMLASLDLLDPRPASAGEPVKLKGDASSRSYYRIELAGYIRPSVVAMDMSALRSGRSEEASKGIGRSGCETFIDVLRWLERAGVRAPAVLAYSEPDALILLEDLGDRTMEAAVGEASAEGRLDLYRKAIDVLARMQKHAVSDRNCIAFSRAFERDLYVWELNHFVEFGMDARGFSPEAADRKRLGKIFESISSELDALPRGFTHRDFQSRNFMLLPGGGMALIDFQDALLGPAEYDLVALLRDSYVRLDAAEIDVLLDYYLEARNRSSFPYPGGLKLRERFDLLTVQRKLKDAGRFVFIDKVKKNPSFLPYIPDSLSYARAALERQPALAELRSLLGRYVPELA